MKWPKDSYVVFGSGPMAAAGIRESSDIDLLVSDELAKQLEADGWQEMEKTPNDKPLVRDDFEAHRSWDFSSFSPTLKDLLSRADFIDDVPFASLEDVVKWKSAGRRPKDLKDIELINAYKAKNK